MSIYPKPAFQEREREEREEKRRKTWDEIRKEKEEENARYVACKFDELMIQFSSLIQIKTKGDGFKVSNFTAGKR